MFAPYPHPSAPDPLILLAAHKMLVALVIAGTAMLIALASTTWTGRRLFHRSEGLARLRGGLAFVWSLTAWLVLASTQQLMPGDPFLLSMGVFVLPLALLSSWRFVWLNLHDVIRNLYASKAYRWLAAAAAFGYAAFYLWSTNLVAPPEPEDLPPPGTPAFLVGFESYGPLSVWPNVEFWLPGIPLFGAISVGTGMLTLGLAALVALSVVMLAHLITLRCTSPRAGSLLAGSTALTLGTNFCCCCAPAIYPALMALFGSGIAPSIAGLMTGSSAPLYNLAQVGSLALATGSAFLLGRRIKIQLRAT